MTRACVFHDNFSNAMHCCAQDHHLINSLARRPPAFACAARARVARSRFMFRMDCEWARAPVPAGRPADEVNTMTRNSPLRTLHAAGRNDFALTFVPVFILMPALLFLLYKYPTMVDTPTTVPWWAWVSVMSFCLLFPLFTMVRARLTTRYVITNRSLSAEVGLFTRTSNEIRIVDIRGIAVRQSLIDRIIRTGDIAFSSSAGDSEEVIFRAVSNPVAIKELVKDLQDELRPAGFLAEGDDLLDDLDLPRTAASRPDPVSIDG